MSSLPIMHLEVWIEGLFVCVVSLFSASNLVKKLKSSTKVFGRMNEYTTDEPTKSSESGSSLQQKQKKTFPVKKTVY